MYLSVLYAFVATFITWGVTALGSAMVLFFKSKKETTLNKMLGFSSGVMIAASFWSLIAPAIEESANKIYAVLNTTSGIFFGMLLMIAADRIVKTLNKEYIDKLGDQKLIMLVLSITIHNIPEGLAVGVAFGACKFSGSLSAFIPAIIVAVGIAIQNFPEGAAVSLPMLNYGLSKKKSFFIGQLSAIVEPVFGVLGAILVAYVNKILPFCLSVAAGCMIYVVVDELVPSSKNEDDISSTVCFILGFIIMMILDLTL